MVLYNRESRADGRQKPEPWNDRRRDNRQRRDALKKGTGFGRPVRRDQIAERDGYRCGLCHKKVNMTLAWPLPGSPSLDHIIPLTKGGIHDPVNIQLAHLVCNTAKGNRATGEQLLLIG